MSFHDDGALESKSEHVSDGGSMTSDELKDHGKHLCRIVTPYVRRRLEHWWNTKYPEDSLFECATGWELALLLFCGSVTHKMPLQLKPLRGGKSSKIDRESKRRGNKFYFVDAFVDEKMRDRINRAADAGRAFVVIAESGFGELGGRGM